MYKYKSKIIYKTNVMATLTVITLLGLSFFLPFSGINAKPRAATTTAANAALGGEDLMAQALLFYKKGAYGDVVKFIDDLNLKDRPTIHSEDLQGKSLPNGSGTLSAPIGKNGGLTRELKATLYYFQGLSYNKLQQFDKASDSFDLAIKSGVKALMYFTSRDRRCMLVKSWIVPRRPLHSR